MCDIGNAAFNRLAIAGAVENDIEELAAGALFKVVVQIIAD